MMASGPAAVRPSRKDDSLPEPVKKHPRRPRSEGPYRETLRRPKDFLFRTSIRLWREDRCFEAVSNGEHAIPISTSAHSDRKDLRVAGQFDKGQAFVPTAIAQTPRKGCPIRMRAAAPIRLRTKTTTSGFANDPLGEDFYRCDERASFVHLSTDKTTPRTTATSRPPVPPFLLLPPHPRPPDPVLREHRPAFDGPLGRRGPACFRRKATTRLGRMPEGRGPGGGKPPLRRGRRRAGPTRLADPVQEGKEPASSSAVEVAARPNLDARGVATIFPSPEERNSRFPGADSTNAYGQMIPPTPGLMRRALEAGRAQPWSGRTDA